MATLGINPGLPKGGGYLITGLTDRKPNQTVGNLQAVTLTTNQVQVWRGVDTNFVLRARGGLRISGGTSTGRRNVDQCALLTDNPPTGARLMEGRERDCARARDFQTNVRGTASYTIPWVDVLASATFSYRPGVQINANYQIGLADLAFASDAVIVETAPAVAGSTSLPAGSPRVVGVQGATNSRTTVALLSNDTYGEGIRLFDFRLAKNIRFAGKRVNIGVDVFNVFNSDAALGYCADYPNPSLGIEGCGTAAAGTLIPWGAVNNITTPRYARFQVQFDF
jgi:hypothetical protein